MSSQPSEQSGPTQAPAPLEVTQGLSTTPQPIKDSGGTASPLELSTNSVIVLPGANLGVGITPTFPLHVGNNYSVRFELNNDNAMLSLGAPGQFNVDAVNVPAGRFTVTNSGNVGINQPSPAYTLDVTGTIHATGQLAVAGIQPKSTAPSSANLQGVFVDKNTGILYSSD